MKTRFQALAKQCLKNLEGTKEVEKSGNMVNFSYLLKVNE